MIGEQALDYLIKNKAIIQNVIIADYEGNGIKCLYVKGIEQVLSYPYWFRDDNGDYDCYNEDNTYTILLGVTFKTNEAGMELGVYTEGYVDTLKKMLKDSLSADDLGVIMRKYNTFI